MGGGGAQRPVLRVNKPKKMGARSARARTGGQNPLVDIRLDSSIVAEQFFFQFAVPNEIQFLTSIFQW
jgi:hypothetical protein